MAKIFFEKPISSTGRFLEMLSLLIEELYSKKTLKNWKIIPIHPRSVIPVSGVVSDSYIDISDICLVKFHIYSFSSLKFVWIYECLLKINKHPYIEST